MGSRKVKADCRADTRGGPWAGIPVCVINSAAYRDCSVHARAILIELVARMNGYNNGKIAVSQRELAEALRCHARKVVRGIVELWEHGLLDVTVEGKWKERMAREYRLTFVSTKHASATNEYRDWTPPVISGVATVESEKGKSAASVESEAQKTVATLESERRNSLKQAPRCQARTRAGKSCRSPAVKDKRVCRMHGGARGSKAPKGEANGMYRHGGWTKEAVELRREASRLLKTIRQAEEKSPDR